MFFLVSKRTLIFFWEVVIWMLPFGRARHPGPVAGKDPQGRLSVEVVNAGGWLSNSSPC